ncbi:MAG: 50S ribosomal protein L24 [Euryarchaeota archaeon]|nr:50S ribosomal protein L24 [Euryarchaeota archaeon]
MITSKKARKQRKYLYNAPLHKKRKWIASHLEENLLLKYDRRSIPVIKGDTVKVMRGNFKGHEDKISHVNVKKQIVEIEGLTMIKADGKKIAKPIHPSNVLIIKLNLTDSWRRGILERGLSEEAKKEIEREAKEQIREQEIAKKKAEEDAKKEEERIKAEESEEKKETEPETKATEQPSAEPEIQEEKPIEEIKTEPAIEPEEKKTKKMPAKKTVPKKKKEAEP